MTEDTSMEAPDMAPTDCTPGTALRKLLMFGLAVNPTGTSSLLKSLQRSRPEYKPGPGVGTNRMRRIKAGKKG